MASGSFLYCIKWLKLRTGLFLLVAIILKSGPGLGLNPDYSSIKTQASGIRKVAYAIHRNETSLSRAIAFWNWLDRIRALPDMTYEPKNISDFLSMILTHYFTKKLCGNQFLSRLSLFTLRMI